METKLAGVEFSKYLFRVYDCGPKDVQQIFKFENGYGASVIKNQWSYGGKRGLWELAVIKYSVEHDWQYDLVYDTPITDDTIGWLDDEGVRDILRKIKELEKE